MNFIEVQVASTGKSCLINVDRINYICPALRSGTAYTMIAMDSNTFMVDEPYESIHDAIMEKCDGKR